MVDIAVVRPEGDATENALSAWASLVIGSVSGSPNVALTDLRGPSVNRTAVNGELASRDALLYFGHGEEDRLGDPTALVDTQNVSQASRRVLIGIACKAAAKLANNAFSQGVRAFLSFDDILTVYLSRPSIFGQVIENALIPFILSGASIADVERGLISGFQRLETYYLSGAGTADPDATVIWMAAHMNWRGVKYVGNSSTTIP